MSAVAMAMSIVRSAEDVHWVPSKDRGIKEKVYTSNFEGGHQIGVKEAHFENSAVVLPHTHRGMDELFYCQAGQGTILVNGVEHLVHPGTVVIVKAGDTHGLKANLGSAWHLLCVATVSSGHESDKTPWKPVS